MGGLPLLSSEPGTMKEPSLRACSLLLAGRWCPCHWPTATVPGCWSRQAVWLWALQTAGSWGCCARLGSSLSPLLGKHSASVESVLKMVRHSICRTFRCAGDGCNCNLIPHSCSLLAGRVLRKRMVCLHIVSAWHGSCPSMQSLLPAHLSVSRGTWGSNCEECEASEHFPAPGSVLV